MKLMTGKTVGKLKKKKLKELKTESVKLQSAEQLMAELEDPEEPTTPTPTHMTMFGDVTSICYVDSSNNNEAIGWGTSNGFFSVVLKLNEDLSKSSNRVETFYIPNKERINCVRGLCMQIQKDEQ